jgi:2-polyprenyl-6-methoxyphenol hydroxylase-like FAD-dependent oxidoreductase
MVCYDETLERYPWLAPAENRTPTATTRGWQDEYSARPANEECDTELADKLTSLLEAELPSFLKDIGRENLKTARINRHVSWVEINMSDVDDSAVCFATRNGRAVLIGDAAHAVTPTMGEGANLAMQSAVSLVNSLTKSDSEGAVPTIDELSAAFLKYGKSRPKEVEAVQQKSAAMCRFENARMRK